MLFYVQIKICLQQEVPFLYIYCHKNLTRESSEDRKLKITEDSHLMAANTKKIHQVPQYLHRGAHKSILDTSANSRLFLHRSMLKIDKLASVSLTYSSFSLLPSYISYFKGKYKNDKLYLVVWHFPIFYLTIGTYTRAGIQSSEDCPFVYE